MSGILLGLAPVFALIALGWGLKASGFLPPQSWPPIERLVYFALYPGFLIPTIWRADLTGLSAGPLGLATVGTVLLVGGACVLLRPAMPLSGPAFTSVFQGVVRWNAFVFVPVVGALHGPRGLALTAVVMAALIPVVNVLCVLVLARWGDGQRGGGRRALARSLVTNPILASCVIGVLLNLAEVPPVPGLFQTLQLLGAAALPLGLVIAGAGLSFRDAALRPGAIAAVTAVKLLVLPVLMWGLCRAFGGDALAQSVAVACGSTPGAAASYVLARQMGGDAPLMAGIVAFTTVASAVTMPLLLIGFGIA